MIKLVLEHANRVLLSYNNSSTHSLWSFWHKWNYEHTLVKNVLRFSNRVLKQINKYHVFRWDWMVGVAGVFTGFLVTQLQQLYYQIKIGYKPTTSQLISKALLHNQTIALKLNQTLDVNVFKSEYIQFYVQQAILNQVLTPQKQNIKNLITFAIKDLNSQQNIQNISQYLASQISILNQPIKNNALPFLQSPTMDKIVANGLKSVLDSLFVKEIMATQINEYVKNFFKDNKNNQYLYTLIRDKIAF